MHCLYANGNGVVSLVKEEAARVIEEPCKCESKVWAGYRYKGWLVCSHCRKLIGQ